MIPGLALSLGILDPLPIAAAADRLALTAAESETYSRDRRVDGLVQDGVETELPRVEQQRPQVVGHDRQTQGEQLVKDGRECVLAKFQDSAHDRVAGGRPCGYCNAEGLARAD